MLNKRRHKISEGGNARQRGLEHDHKKQWPDAVGNGPRDAWVYLACIGIFCLGLSTVAIAFGADRFVAQAMIFSDAETSSHFDLPFTTKLPEPILRKVIETQALATDPEFGGKRAGWVSRIGMVLGLFNPLRETARGQDHTLQALEEAVAVHLGHDDHSLSGLGAVDVMALHHVTHPALVIEVATQDASKSARIANAVAQALADQQKAGETEKQIAAQKAADDAASFASKLQRANQDLAELRSVQDERDHSESTHAPTLADAKADVVRIAKALATQLTSNLNGLHFPTPDIDRLAADYAGLQQQIQKRKLSLGDMHPELLALEAQLRTLQGEFHVQWLKAADTANRQFRIAQANDGSRYRETAIAPAAGSADASAQAQILQAEIIAARHDYEHALSRQAKVEASLQGDTLWRISPAEMPASATHQPHGFIAGTAMILGAMFGAGRTLSDGRRELRRRPLSQPKNAAAIFPIPRIKRSWFADKLRLKPELDVACCEVMDQPDSDFSQAMEELCAFEARQNTQGMVKILLASKQNQLGTTTVAVNFAQMIAKAGNRVLLIEANRRNPVLASLISSNVNVDLIELMGTKRIICQLRPRLSVIPLFNEDETETFGANARRCIKGLNRHFDAVIIDGGVLDRDDDEMMDMVEAVNRVYYLTPEGIEIKSGFNSCKVQR